MGNASIGNHAIYTIKYTSKYISKYKYTSKYSSKHKYTFKETRVSIDNWTYTR